MPVTLHKFFSVLALAMRTGNLKCFGLNGIVLKMTRLGGINVHPVMVNFSGIFFSSFYFLKVTIFCLKNQIYKFMYIGLNFTKPCKDG